MTDIKTIEMAERASRRRRRGLWFSGLLFLMWQGAFYRWGTHPDPVPGLTPDGVKVAAWAVWSALLLFILASGGGYFSSKAVRRLMNDEVSVANRNTAQRWGFWAAMLTALALYGTSLFVQLTVHETLHAVLTVGIGVALMRYAILERRSERAGA